MRGTVHTISSVADSLCILIAISHFLMDWMFTSKWLSTTTLFHRCRVIKAAKNVSGPTLSNLQLAEGEIILDIDGTVPLQPVLQHIGISAWPGEFYLTIELWEFILGWVPWLIVWIIIC